MPATALASASFTILSTSFSLSMEASGLEVLCSSPLPFSLETVDRAGAAVLVEQRQLGGEAPPWLRVPRRCASGRAIARDPGLTPRQFRTLL